MATQHQTMSENQALTKGQRLGWVLSQLDQRREELAAVLPPDIRFEAFHATINQAIRSNPELLDCEPRSLVNACVKAAYDGLRVDGREAAIVWELATVKVRGEPDRKVKQARYMPMYQGLVQQVLRGGMVLACEADVIYENDHYRLIGGSDRRVEHIPLTEIGADRGRMVAAYNVATLASGYKAVHWLLAAEILDIQKESKSGWDAQNNCARGVWKRWPKEQWKKTVLRQHRKTLPIGRDVVIRDMEASDDFPQFAAPTPHPQLAPPPRPTRRPAIDDRSGTAAGVPLDLRDEGAFATVERQDELLDEPRGNDGRQMAAKVAGNTSGQHQPDTDRPLPALDLPADAAEWSMWLEETKANLRTASTHGAVDTLFAQLRPAIEAAPGDIADAARAAFTDRIGDLIAQEGED